MPHDPQSVLVTGSAGFIGFHVAQALLARGDQVLGLDNFNEYYPSQIKRRRHEILRKHPNFIELERDLADGESISLEFAEFGPEVVVNLAAYAGVRHSLTHPEDYVRSNLVGFVNIMEACRHHGVSRLVYASSSSVYGGNKDLPFRVSDRVDQPISLYAASKKANELLAHSYTHLYDLQTIGLRLFTVYGPWGRPDMAMWIFAEKILAGEPLPVFNEGNMQRDFTWIGDIVAGVLACIDSTDLQPYEVFNLGNNRSEPLMDVINRLGDALGKEPQLELLPMQPGDVPASFADIDHARSSLGFEPTTTIADGIPQFVEWYQSHPDIAAAARNWRRSQA